MRYILISHFFGLRKICLADFYFTLSMRNLKLHKRKAIDNTFIQEKLLTRLTFNPGLALTGFRTISLIAHTEPLLPLSIERNPAAMPSNNLNFLPKNCHLILTSFPRSQTKTHRVSCRLQPA